MDRRVLKEAARLADLHDPYVLALIVATEGSAPRRHGGTMLLRSDGTFLGTVGGAQFEEEVKKEMASTLQSHRGALRHFELRGWKPGALPSRCGGSVDVAFQYMPGGPNILVWGAGHTGLALCHVLAELGYDHSIADDRPKLVTQDRFPGAKNRWVVGADELPSRVAKEGARFSHVYLLGYDAAKDEEVLAGLLPGFSGPIGLIASRTKRGLTMKSLEKRGFSRKQLAPIRSPVGIPIGADSPEEIAISIAAEIIRDVRGTE